MKLTEFLFGHISTKPYTKSVHVVVWTVVQMYCCANGTRNRILPHGIYSEFLKLKKVSTHEFSFFLPISRYPSYLKRAPPDALLCTADRCTANASGLLVFGTRCNKIVFLASPWGKVTVPGKRKQKRIAIGCITDMAYNTWNN